MDIQEMFSILGLDETTDAELIRAAYLKKLNTVNPEDNPEGFKRLRRAYEEALLYGKRQAEPTAEVEETPVGTFLRKAEEIYRSLSRRIDRAEWEKLLKDDILDDLDMGEEAKWRLFVMLADKYWLSSDIWRVLDHVFGIVQNEQRFKEHLNVNFVDFMIRNIVSDTEEGLFTYASFQGRDQADYDTFLEGYYKLRRLLNTREPEDRTAWEKEISGQEAFLDSLEISHPRYVLEKARICVLHGEKAKAEELARGVLAQETGTDRDPFILLGGAEALRGCGCSDEAEELLRELLE
ncbi:MAG: J domain-containing protein, partial [Lachnospiraceae bacterium]|nr:J domain-containing protein [Lachnospiraceae bacterium]